MRTSIIAFIIFIALCGAASAEGFVCTECHSKDPKIRAMHEALGFKGCETCHASRTDVKFTDEAKRNRSKDPRCVRCHQK